MDTTKTIAPTTSTLAGFMQDRVWIGHAEQAVQYDGAVPREAALELLSYPLAEGAVTVTVLTPNGVLSIEAPDRKAVVRTDTQTVFGMFKKGYVIHQPAEWCLQNVDLLLHGGLEIGTVALTKGGVRAFLQAELPEGRIAEAPGAEPVAHRPHIFAATSHDGSIATTYGIGTKVLICENELSVGRFGAYHSGIGSSFSALQKIRHTSQSGGRIFEIRENLGLIVEEIGDAFDQQFKALTSEYVSDARFLAAVNAFAGVSDEKQGRSKTIADNKARTLNNLWRNDQRVAPWRNNAYGVLAAFNTAAHHEFGADKDRVGRNQDRTIEGEWDKFDANILNLLATV